VEKVGRKGNISHLGNGEGLPVVKGLKLGELILVLEDEVTDAVEDPSAVRGGHGLPRTRFKGRPSTLHSQIDITGITMSGMSDDLKKKEKRLLL
jgi:hypothetical protein